MHTRKQETASWWHMCGERRVSLARSVRMAPRRDTSTCRELSARGFSNGHAQLAAHHVKRPSGKGSADRYLIEAGRLISTSRCR